MKIVARHCVMLFAVVGLGTVAHVTTAQAQTAASRVTLKGTVLDPDKKAVGGAVVVVRGDAENFTRTLNSGPDGVFAVADAPVGVYSVEVFVTGFPTVRRVGVHLNATGSRPLVMILSLGTVSEQVEVTGSVLPAAAGAPSQGSLTATSAESIVSSDFIHDFTPPAADFAEIVQMVPGTFSLNPNGVGLGQGKTFFRGLPTASTDDLRRHPVPGHEQSHASLVGVLPGAHDWLGGLRPEPRVGLDARSGQLRPGRSTCCPRPRSTRSTRKPRPPRVVRHAGRRPWAVYAGRGFGRCSDDVSDPLKRLKSRTK